MVKIDKNVEIPEITRCGGRPAKYPWHAMEVGDSFFVPDKKSCQFGGLIQYAKKKTGYKYSVRKEGDGIRVWRVG